MRKIIYQDLILAVTFSLSALSACDSSPNGDSPIEGSCHSLATGGLRIEAESFSDAQGLVNYGAGISEVDGGDWVNFSRVDFGAAGSYTHFVANLGTPSSGNHVEVRMDSLTGPLIADLVTLATGGFGVATEQSTRLLTPIAGVHDVYVKFNGDYNFATCQNECWSKTTPLCEAAFQSGCGFGIGNFDWFEFLPARPVAPNAATVVSLTAAPVSPVSYQLFTLLARVTTAEGQPVNEGSIVISGLPGIVGGGLTVNQNGTAGITTKMPASTLNIVAVYTGQEHETSQANFTLVVRRAKTSTTVTVGAPSARGLTSFAVVTVVDAPSDYPSRPGSNEYACTLDAANIPCTGLGGSFTVPAGSTGLHTLNVDFLGDSVFEPSRTSVSF